jgi:hypothetical protein
VLPAALAAAAAAAPACALLTKLGELLLGREPEAPARGGVGGPRLADLPAFGAFLESAGALSAGVGAAFAAALGSERRLALLTARAGAARALPPPPWEAAGPPAATAMREAAAAPAASPRTTRALHRDVAVALGALLEATARLGEVQSDAFWNAAYSLGAALLA